MHPTLRAGTVLMQTGTVMPESVWVEKGSYFRGWEVIKNLDGDSLDRNLRKSNWNFFFIAGSIHAISWGSGNGITARRTAIRALAKTKVKKFNCFEITEVTFRRFLGIPYVSVVGHSRHVQEDRVLESSVHRGQRMLEIASQRAFDDTAVAAPGVSIEPIGAGRLREENRSYVA